MAFKPENLFLTGFASTRRQLPQELSDAVNEFAAPVGQVMWAWNYCHSSFGRLFSTIASPTNLRIGHALWHALQSDRAQRQLLLAAAKAALYANKPMLRQVEWAAKSADSLATIRNDAAHVATAFTTHFPQPKVVPDVLATSSKRLRRLQSHQGLQEQFQLLTGDLIALSGYVTVLSMVIASPNTIKLSRRPMLKSLR